MYNKVVKIKDIVYHLLIDYPELRDNDRQLMLNVWAKQDGSLVNGRMFRDFALGFKRGDFADPESIRRTRQKLQELHPELRGRTYRERQNLSSQMRNEIPRFQL